MLKIGLTGSIAMGKSTAGNYLVAKGLPLFSADDEVHELYRHEAVEPVRAAFPEAVVNNEVDRVKLSQILLKNSEKIRQLEAIVHPMVEAKRVAFIKQHLEKRVPMIVLDIPLLFEKNLKNGVDVILLVTVPPDIQAERAMKRPGMTVEKLQLILDHQMPDEEKRRRADFIIDTSGSFEETHAKLDSFLESVQHQVWSRTRGREP